MSRSTERFDRVVIGGGAMGLAAAWQLAQRGIRVVLLERFEPGHARGASHGATRNMNNAYADDHFLDLYDEALRLFRELERRSGRELLVLDGLVTHGAEQRVQRSYEALRARGAAAEMVSAATARERWPGLRFETDALVNREAGRVYAADALEALAGLARQHGAELRYGHRVVGIEPGADRVTVTAEGPDGLVRIDAERAVVAAGAWTAPLLGELVGLPPLTVTEEHPAHFAIRAGYESAAWPSFNHFPPELDVRGGSRGTVYGMLTPGEGVKVGLHLTGEAVDPDARDFRATDELRRELRAHVAEWFPGLDPDTAEEISCTYTSTESERFVLDQSGPLTIAAGFSGQGFKFVPAIGRVLADATLGEALPPEPFRLGSHASPSAPKP
ncbi:FAD-dependent oxidoreductase [Leucobacter chironomi]|uniref:FAD-dependent oxidoreductase n=1 Tax=Leucobacter chironomi TaxID=491918 RepID=UPI001F0AAAC1|nr:FAD-dependent oxidoreductase [Leucobacter chironomi]